MFSRAERLRMLDKDHPDLSIKTQGYLLSLGYSSLFYQTRPPSAHELAIKRPINVIYTAIPFYGSWRITVTLQPEFDISRPAVQAYIREMGIVGFPPGPNTSKSSQVTGHQI